MVAIDAWVPPPRTGRHSPAEAVTRLASTPSHGLGKRKAAALAKFFSPPWTATARVGFDCPLTRAVADAVRIPVIASGGAGGADDFIEVFRDGHADAALAASIFHYGVGRLVDLKQQLAIRGRSHEAAMLIPSIDLMGGKVVQLVQGQKKALEFDDFEEWVDRFSKYPLVQVIDLDAAMGQGDNRALVQSRRRRAARWAAELDGGASSRNAGRRRFASDCRIVSY